MIITVYINIDNTYLLENCYLVQYSKEGQVNKEINHRAKTEVICLGVLLAIYVSLGIRNLPLLINDKYMILFLITLSVISSLAHPITGKDWGKNPLMKPRCVKYLPERHKYIHAYYSSCCNQTVFVHISICARRHKFVHAYKLYLQ